MLKKVDWGEVSKEPIQHVRLQRLQFGIPPSLQTVKFIVRALGPAQAITLPLKVRDPSPKPLITSRPPFPLSIVHPTSSLAVPLPSSLVPHPPSWPVLEMLPKSRARQ